MDDATAWVVAGYLVGIAFVLAAYGYARERGIIGPGAPDETTDSVVCLAMLWPVLLLVAVVVGLGYAAFCVGRLIAREGRP